MLSIFAMNEKQNIDWKHLALAAVLVAACPPTAAADLYVDPVNGKDTNDGAAPAAAFRTIARARDTIRAKKLNLDMKEDLHVFLRGGRHQLDKTLYFDARDSGSGGHDVVYKAWKDEKPVVCGGRRVTGWKPVAGKPYFAAPVPVKVVKRRDVLHSGRSEPLHPRFYDVHGLAPDSFAPYFAQLYVNGVRAERARSHDVIRGSRKVWWDDPDTVQLRDGLYVKKADIKQYTNPGDIRLLWLELFKTFDAPVRDLLPCPDSEDEAVFRMKQPDFDTGSSWKRIQPQTEFFVVNALEELDEPGEWYLDRKKHVVYYYPFKRDGDMSRAVVYAPRVEGLWKIDGYPMQKVSHIRVEGVTFQCGAWNAAKDHYLGVSQAEIFRNYTSQIPGQIVVDNAHDITIRGCTVRHMGSCGIEVYEGCDRILIEGNVTRDTTGAGITIGRWWLDSRECPPDSVCTNVMVRDNVVRDTGRDYWQGTGINIFAAYGCKIHHNDVSDIAYTALHARIGDSNFIHPRIGKLEYKYNKVSRAFAGHKWGIGDGGQLYMHGRYPGSIVAENDSLYANRNINLEYYCDNSSHTILWTKNISRHCKARFNYRSSNPKSVGIVFDGNYGDRPCTSAGNAKLLDYHYVQNGDWPPEARRIMAAAGLEPKWRHLLDHIYGHENLARGKPCRASSENDEKMAASMGADGDWNTIWHTKVGGDGQGWWSVDLGAKYVIQKVTILPRQDLYQDHARKNLEVQASNDPEFKKYVVLAEQNDVPWYNKTTSHASNLWEKFLDVPEAYRYLRVKSTQGPGSLNFAEFGAYGFPAGAVDER